MKKLILFIVLLGAIRIAMAQVPPATFTAISSTQNFSNIPSSQEVVCSNGADLVVTYSKKTATPAVHQFVVKDLSANTSKAISFANTEYVTYQIYDCDMAGDICYFCGAKLAIPFRPETHPITDYIGFVGYFNAADVINGSTQYTIIDINNTYALTKIAANPSNQDLLTIGLPTDSPLTADNQPTTTCIAGIYQDESGLWRYDMKTPMGNGEILTDVTVCDEGFLTISRFEGDGHSFGVRYVKRTPISDDAMNYQLKNLYRFNTNSIYITPMGTTGISRIGETPILIDNHTVAFVCQTDNNDLHGVAMFRLDLASLGSVGLMQVAESKFVKMAPGIELLDMANYSFGTPRSHQAEYVALLINDTPNSRAEIIQTRWDIANQNADNQLTCNHSEALLRSITAAQDGKYIYVSGHTNNTDNHATSLYHFFQHSAYFHDAGLSCLGNTSYLTYRINECPSPEVTECTEFESHQATVYPYTANPKNPNAIRLCSRTGLDRTYSVVPELEIE